MTTLTLGLVSGWRPEALSDAAGGVASARAAIDDEVARVKRAMTALDESWSGAAADAAARRVAQQVATGAELVDALDTARAVLHEGAADIGTTRARLLAVVAGAASGGFTVGADGSVTPPTLPPVMSSPEHAAAAAAERDARQHRLNDEAVTRAADIGRALQAVADADRRTADALSSVPIPQTLGSAVRAYVERLRTSHDALEALGATGAAGVTLAFELKKGHALFEKSGAYARWFKAATAPITHYDAFVANMAAADAAMREFRFGKPNGGVARVFVGSQAAKLAGRAFLPLTIATGAMDVATGGGYDGARGWATRGFALGGAAGAGALLLPAATLGPVGLAVAGGAVLAYTAWSVGNYVYDNREAIGRFFTKAGEWVTDRMRAGVVALGEVHAWAERRVDDAKEWAGDRVEEATEWGRARLDEAEDTVKNVGKGLLKVVKFKVFG